jgi:hypothetical protein
LAAPASLCAGSLTLGIEKTLARLAEDNPESLARPTVLRGEEVPGIRVRDNVVVPWWCEEDSGLLVLRGVPRPSRPGLGEAIALAGAAVWPRLLGSPATRIEAVLRELQGGATRLEAEVARQIERRPPRPRRPRRLTPLAARVGDREAELQTLRQERDSPRASSRPCDASARPGLDLAAPGSRATTPGATETARSDRRARASGASRAQRHKRGGEEAGESRAPVRERGAVRLGTASAALKVAVAAAPGGFRAAHAARVDRGRRRTRERGRGPRVGSALHLDRSGVTEPVAPSSRPAGSRSGSPTTRGAGAAAQEP